MISRWRTQSALLTLASGHHEDNKIGEQVETETLVHK
jgi:hypothetical protein